MAKLPTPEDPTIAAVKAAMELAQDTRPRSHLGASAIGHPCSRKLWYGFHWVAPMTFYADTLTRFDDGHRSEDIVAERLRMVHEIELLTHTEDGNQYRFTDLGGHFAGSADGLVRGLLQAPKTPHVWEHKCVNEKKFAKLDKLKIEKGEKSALAHWDEVYFAQAQVYMHYFKMTRHYLTCATPGSRDLTSCRTDYDRSIAESLVQKAQAVIASDAPPTKLSEKPDYYLCKWCDFKEQCHYGMPVDANCRTCANSQPVDGGWYCNQHTKWLDYDAQREGCPTWRVRDGLDNIMQEAS